MTTKLTEREEFEKLFYTENGFNREDIPELVEEVWSWIQSYTSQQLSKYSKDIEGVIGEDGWDKEINFRKQQQRQSKQIIDKKWRINEI